MENKNLTNHLGELFHLISAYEELNLSLVDKRILTPSELHIVECIGKKEQMTSKEIGEELNITKGAVSQQIKKLIESKIVEKKVSEKDRRVSFLRLTEIGLSFYEEHQKIKLGFESLLLENLSHDEMIGFIKGISLLNSSLQAQVKRGKKHEK